MFILNIMENKIPACFYRISAKALFLDESRTKFLLMREDTGLRDFPGWWLDFWENLQEGIIREFNEEAWLEATWIDTKPCYFVTAYRENKNFWIANIMYEAKLKNLDFIPSDECQEIMFFTKEEAEKLKLQPNVKEFLKQFISG